MYPCRIRNAAASVAASNRCSLSLGSPSVYGHARYIIFRFSEISRRPGEFASDSERICVPLPAQGVAGAAGVGADLEGAALFVDQDPAPRAGEPDPVGPALDLMAAPREFGGYLLREAALDAE